MCNVPICIFVTISIHAPREGGDSYILPYCIFSTVFQSTPPARGATRRVIKSSRGCIISIHAPREGGDQGMPCRPLSLPDFNPRPPRGGRHTTTHCVVCQEDFNPRPPRGGRLLRHLTGHSVCEFQSTPPARGATSYRPPVPSGFLISIHAPREGGD